MTGQLRTHSAHWGAFHAGLVDGRLVVRPHAGDPDPNPLIENFPGAVRHPARIAAPAVRRGWLERGPGPDAKRGRDEFVEVTWDEAFDLLGRELQRVRDQHGPGAVFGGSYGWSSAGRFHHVQSQVHRFLNIALGGYVRSVNTYSAGCAEALIPHVFGNYDKTVRRNVTWEQIAAGPVDKLDVRVNKALAVVVVGLAGMEQHVGNACNRNPFHHHQDLTRLSRAFAQLDTFVVNDIAWTASARHADIVLPATMTLEREDIGSAPTDPLMLAMHKVLEPYGQARDDYDIFCGLAERLGVLEAFSEGRTAREWLHHLYGKAREGLLALGHEAPDFDTFWAQGELTIPQLEDDGGMLRAYREDPIANRLATPDGKIQISSPVIAGFGYDDCPGHPVWLEPTEPPTPEHPLYLISNQPAARLHSQLDFGGHSQSTKLDGREVCTMHPVAAQARGIEEGDLVRLFNARGACIAAARLSDEVLPGVVQLPTGAWYDPEEEAPGRNLCVHGNPNALTRDLGTSRLTQGCSGQLTVVQVEKLRGGVRPVRAFEPPKLARSSA